MKTFYLALDLKNDEQLMKEYEEYHQAVWPSILKQIKETGILTCEIYKVHNRLLMVLQTTEDFSFERKAQLDATDPNVQEWEALMWRYQQAIPGSMPNEKWQLMTNIFSLS
jgi:L-rhamnose mutarotase